MMRFEIIIALLFAFILPSISANAQEEKSSIADELTVKRNAGFNPGLFIPEEFLFELNIEPESILRGMEDSATIRLRTEMSISISRYSAFVKPEERFY